jgi:N-acetylglucosamine kinase-like BadF-type ATPase
VSAEPLVLAVDGGNSKTHLALARADGEVLALARGPMSSPHHIGMDGCIEVLTDLLHDARLTAGLWPNGAAAAPAAVGEFLVAGADLPEEEAALQEAIEALGWASRVRVANDTFAVLRAGTESPWGVAVVCGAGINCVGVGPDGAQARFPSLGRITGDWGGGYDVGLAALFAAARSADGRGPRTVLEQRVPAHFGLPDPDALAEALHQRRIDERRLVELAPMVFQAGPTDAVAHALVERLAGEVVALARVALERLGQADAPAEVVLGGGLLRDEHEDLITAVRRDLAAVAPHATIRVARDAPIVGAALLGLDHLAAGDAARQRLRAELRAATHNGGTTDG